MKDFLKRLQEAIVAVFGEGKKASDITSVEDKQAVADKYTELFNSDLIKDSEDHQEALEKAGKYDQALSLLGGGSEDDGKGKDDGEEGSAANPPAADLDEGIKKLQQEKVDLAKKNKELVEKNEKLAAETETLNPKIENVKAIVIGRRHSTTHLFGIEHKMYSLEKRWNRVMANPALVKAEEVDERTVFPAFQKEVEEFGAAISKRIQHLHEIGGLIPNKTGAGLDIDYSDLSNAGLGDQFVIFRTDEIIARLLAVPSVDGIFPKRYGIQDRDLLTNAFLGDFSQGYQVGEVWKGAIDLQPELGYVDDAMYKTLFNSMKWIERQYVGYLNTSGSDPIKLSMIEWSVLQIGQKLLYEQYERAVTGIFVKPVTGQAGHYLNAGTGYIYSLIRYLNELKLNPFADAGLSDYDSSLTNMLDTVIAFYNKLKESVPNFPEKQYKMYLNENHKFWWKSQYRAEYGLQTDFDGPAINRVPDTDLMIEWVPNMAQLKYIAVAKPGNLQQLGYKPGEMLAIQFIKDMETVKSWSVWKEGFGGDWVGKQFDTIAALVANAYALQEVFMNKPATALVADATTADADDNFWFTTIANTGATVITDISNATEGKAFIIEIGSTTNTTTISKTGKFDQLTTAWTPTAVGDYIMLVYDETASKFYDLERRVGGTRTINTAKQPNVIGGR